MHAGLARGRKGCSCTTVRRVRRGSTQRRRVYVCCVYGTEPGKGELRGTTREPSVLPRRCINVRRFMDTVTDPPDAFESSYIRDSALRNTSGSTSMVGAAALPKAGLLRTQSALYFVNWLFKPIPDRYRYRTSESLNRSRAMSIPPSRHSRPRPRHKSHRPQPRPSRDAAAERPPHRNTNTPANDHQNDHATTIPAHSPFEHNTQGSRHDDAHAPGE